LVNVGVVLLSFLLIWWHFVGFDVIFDGFGGILLVLMSFLSVLVAFCWFRWYSTAYSRLTF